MALNQDWKEFVELLNEKQVEYLIVGAHALALHGRPRLTGDFDVFVNNTPENAARVLRVLQDFGFGSLGISGDDLTSEDCVLQLGYPPRRIDILTRISGVSFADAWSRRVLGRLDELPVPYLSKADFIANKRASGRTKDIADAEALE